MDTEATRSLLATPARKPNKLVSAVDAVRLIHDGDTVAVGGFVGSGVPEAVVVALSDRFSNTGQPRNLTLLCGAGQGDGGERGLNHLALDGLIGRAIGSHWGRAPKIGKLALAGTIRAYTFPLGVMAQWFRDIAAHKPGTLSRVGLGTFVDPRFGGGKVNALTTEDLVELMVVGGHEYLFYKALPIDVAILRGTTADTGGNVTMEKEALLLDGLAIATAAHNSGGIVIVQVERLAGEGTLNPKHVAIPGLLVDCIVVAEPDDHWQTFGERYNPSFSGEIKVPMQSLPPLPLDERKVIARRAALELKPNLIVNLGIGLPEGVASVANEEAVLDLLTLTTEAGSIGGLPAGGLSFGAALNAQAIIDMPATFDFYDGGGIDVAFLGLAQVDSQGNANVSRYADKLSGPGGFINISQAAKRLVLVGTFTAGKPEFAIANGKLAIRREGSVPKFVGELEQRTFSGTHAVSQGQSVLYVTERCVFELTEDGLELVEIAPGVDLERDILAHMEFRPLVRQPRLMDSRLFEPEPMNLKEELLQVPLADRLSYDSRSNVFFVNFEGLQITRAEEIDAIGTLIDSLLNPLDRKVSAVVTYDNCVVSLELLGRYLQSLKRVQERYCTDVTRYSTSAFLRMKQGVSLAK